MKITIRTAAEMFETRDIGAGAYVVIDVLRAFTTSAFAFASGAEEIDLVATTDEAFALKSVLPAAKIMGEEGGFRVEGFDAGNSPGEFLVTQPCTHWIQRTSAGTRATVACAAAEHLIVSSMVCAKATVRTLEALHTDVTLVVSGARGRFDGGDDRACADYLAASLQGPAPDPTPFLDRIRQSYSAAKFLDPGKPAFPSTDLELALELDRFDFAMVATSESERLVLRATG